MVQDRVEAKDDLPQELLRFRSYGRGGKDTDKPEVIQLLKGEVRFANINDFNDPFEGRPFPVPAFDDVGEQRHAVEKYLTNMLDERGFPASEVRRCVAEFMRGKTQAEVVENLGKMMLATVVADEFQVCCFSGPRALSTPLPWSHYADNHKGVCIHFDSAAPPFRFAHRIAYSDAYPRVVVPRSAQDQWEAVERTFLTKCTDWQYEEEYRVIRIIMENTARNPEIARLQVKWEGNVALAPNGVVTGITFGSRMPVELRAELLRTIDELELEIEAYQARLHPSRYEILRDRLR